MKSRQEEQLRAFWPQESNTAPTKTAQFVRSELGHRAIVLVGMMGAGKSSIGRRLGVALDLPFFDADTEIETAAGMSVEDIFKKHGEAFFRDGEERVIKRLLGNGAQVLATGGGAVISAKTRAAIAERGVSIWLNAPIDLLLKRVARRDNRPLLKTADPETVMANLLAERQAYYAQADITFPCRDVPHAVIIEEIIARLAQLFEGRTTSGVAAEAVNPAGLL